MREPRRLRERQHVRRSVLSYDGPEPNAFLPRDEVIGLFRDYAARIKAPVRFGTEVTRVGVVDGGFMVETNQGRWLARNVVLANGAFQRPFPRRSSLTCSKSVGAANLRRSPPRCLLSTAMAMAMAALVARRRRHAASTSPTAIKHSNA